MTPADGAPFGMELSAQDPIRADLTVILPGGRALVALSGLPGPMPARGELRQGARLSQCIAGCWPGRNGRAGLALFDAPLTDVAEIRDQSGRRFGTIVPSHRVDVSPAPLAEFVRAEGVDSRDVFDFLLRVLVSDDRSEERRAEREFAAGFLTRAAEPDGFVEILARPETGGLFAQGWSMSMPTGRLRLARLDGDLSLSEVDVGTFAREDILPPGHGFCFYGRGWDDANLDCVFFEHDGRLRRLDVVPSSVLRLSGEAATRHVADMLPRIEARTDVMGAFRRICRPRYQGEDTLSGTPLPIAAALDAIFQAPDGGILATGWLLDPLQRVERVIVKSTGGLYAPLQDHWNPSPRPDLNSGFAQDPRFARLLDPSDTLHGFLAYAPGKVEQVVDHEVYLELVLDDNSCLFRPVKVTRLESRDRLPQILSAVSPADPAIEQIVQGTLAPFLSGIPTRNRPLRSAVSRPLALSDKVGEIPAIMPFRTVAHLHPVLALLAGSPEAEQIDLVLTTTRGAAVGLAEKLVEMFQFYGINGRLLLTPDHFVFAQQVEAGLACTSGERVLVWSPSALPLTPGWMARLITEMERLDGPGLLSPTLIYEDGSVYYGGAGATNGTPSPLLGYPADWLVRSDCAPMPAGAAEIALIDRIALERAGGFQGRLYSDRFTHRDLAHRLHRAGYGTWCSGRADFWMLQEEPKTRDPHAQLMEKVDAVLIAAAEDPAR
ncbi:hypothetical protein [Paenirhodobacter sp.]|uniref:hypothetical protein n=1 Tax=Paenirhodobacter sp. TaxID=1965326 RepID=UPI003B3D5304